MINFDVSRDWVVLVPPEPAAARKAGADMARIIGLLREQAGLPSRAATLADALRDVPDEPIPIILLNAEPGRDFRNGFSWRLGMDRLEIYGASGRGLCNGVYSFLDALGVRWPRPGLEKLPPSPAPRDGAYLLEYPAVHQPSETDLSRKRRLVITGETPLKYREQAVLWAVRNRIDAVVLPLKDKVPLLSGIAGVVCRSREKLLRIVKDHALAIEAGGWELSLLVPRKIFSFHREVFRMEEGRRVKKYNFCSTNPDTIAIIKREAERRFRENPEVSVFHLWPDRKKELTWCSCPTCRAFTREEQNRIAINTAADVLAEIVPAGSISYYGNPDEPGSIASKPNTFVLRTLPGEAGAGESGLFLAE
ncbi:MAG: DUF4838 domain-containing protein [Treponema sp.]|jgi:hypothetical protein|nr:DUF4838 domain-containing protein [Treponema sp.]